MKNLFVLILLVFSTLGHAQIQLSSNFVVNTALPLDSRLVAADLTARDALSSLRRYEGLIVYVEAENTNYQLVGGIANGDWAELSGGGSGSGLIEWTASTKFKVGDTIWEPTSKLVYVANTTHTSGLTFDDTNWDELANQFLNTNLFIDGNTLSSTDVDGNIIFAPNGAGELETPSIGATRVPYTNATNELIGEDAFSYNDTTDILSVGNVDVGALTITSTDVDSDLSIDANGTGDVNILAPLTIAAIGTNQVPFGDSTDGTIASDTDFLYDATLDKLTAGGLDFEASDITTPLTDTDITASPRGTGSLKLAYGTVEQDLDPQLQFNSIVENGGFEKGVSNISCTNATVATSTDVSGGVNNNQSALITITAASAVCDITLDISNVDEGVNFYAQIFGKTSLGTVEFCPVIDTFEQTCVKFLDENAWEKYTLETKAGATSAVLRVKGGASTSGTVGIDQLNAQTDGILRRNLLEPEIVVRGAGNGGQTVGTSDNIPFTEVEDVQGLWNGDSFTTPKSGEYVVTGSVRLSTNSTATVLVTKDGVTGKSVGDNFGTSSSTIPFAGVVKLSAGEVFSLRLSTSRGLLNDTVYHTIHIQKIPTTEENVITPMKSSTTETKILSANVTTSGDVGDLQFDNLIIGNRYILTGSVYLESQSGELARVIFRSAASGSGDVYTASTSQNRNSPLAGYQFSPAVIFTAKSSTMYANFNGSGSIVANNSKSQTFLQLTNLNAEFLAATAKPYTLGVERVTDRTLKGKKVYEYCNEVASDITTNTTIETIASGLNPINIANYASSLWVIRQYFSTTSTGDRTQTSIRYDKSNGEIVSNMLRESGIGKIRAGEIYCMKYYK